MLKTLQNFYKATVATNWATGTGNRYVTVLPVPTSGTVVINSSDVSKREIVDYSAIGTDAGGNYLTLSARGVGGTTNQTHQVGESVRMNITAEMYAAIQTELNAKVDDTQIDTDGTLAADSDTLIASQKATKTYAMPFTYLDTDVTLAADSDAKVASQKATKAYALPKTGGTMTGTLILNTNTPSTDLEAASKGYVDGIAIAGSPDSSTTVKGIGKVSVAPASPTAPIFVGDNDPRVPTQAENDALVGTGTPSSSNKYVTEDTLVSEIDSVTTFGDGSDGNVTIAAPTTLTRDMYYNDLTVTSTLTTDGYKIFVKGTLSGAGTIDWGTANVGGVGAAGGSAAAPGAGGTAGAASGSGQFVSVAGQTGTSGGNPGGVGTAGTAKTSSLGGNGSAGGAGGNGGGAGGAAGAASVNTKVGVFANLSIFGIDFKKDGTFIPYQAAAGSGSGGGGNSGGTGFGAGGGGGSGATGGTVFIAAYIWAGTFTIKSQGGAGGNGGTSYLAGSGGGGGGAGGRGGSTFVIYKTKTWSGSYNITGGAAGTGGAGTGAGVTGTAGSSGTSYELDITTLMR